MHHVTLHAVKQGYQFAVHASLMRVAWCAVPARWTGHFSLRAACTERIRVHVDHARTPNFHHGNPTFILLTNLTFNPEIMAYSLSLRFENFYIILTELSDSSPKAFRKKGFVKLTFETIKMETSRLFTLWWQYFTFSWIINFFMNLACSREFWIAPRKLSRKVHFKSIPIKMKNALPIFL